MKRLRVVSLIAVTVTALTICSALTASAENEPRVTHKKTPKTPPPPPIDSKTTTSGLQLRGSSKKTSRLKVNTPSPTKPAKKKPVSPPPTPRQKLPELLDPVNTVNPKRKTRLNIGLCGREGPDGTIPGPTRCQPYTPDQPERRKQTAELKPIPPRPQDVTWESVQSETKTVLFPALTVRVQPAGRTLVNLDTIVYTENTGVIANWVSVLGFPVLVEATPKSFTWRFGDGTTLTTTSPGNPYPSKDITHKYMKRAAVNLTVTVTYTARFFVSGVGWRNADGPVSITGPATVLQVREAVPVLVDPGR